MTGAVARTAARPVTLALVGMAVVTAAALVYQSRWNTVTDVSWLITVCERILAGERLYGDIKELNPPFSVWLYMPPVWAADRLGVAPEMIVRAWTFAAALLGLGLAATVARRARFPENPALLTLAPAFYALLVVFPGNAFEQREQIGAALLLPLLALHAWRARGGSPPLPLAVAAGLSGSVLLLLKPYFAVAVLASALVAAFRRGSVRPLFAAEQWIIGGLCVAYLTLVLKLHPDFMRLLYPAVTDVYGRIRSFWQLVGQYGLIYLLVAALAVKLLHRERELPELAATGLAASVASLIPFFYQGKGWPYHFYPAFLFMGSALLVLLAGQWDRQRGAQGRLAGLPVALWVAGAILVLQSPFFWTQEPARDFVAAIRSGAPDRPTVDLIGSDISAAHPLTRLIGGRFVGAYPSDWLGAQSFYLAGVEAAGGDAAAAARYQAMADAYVAAKRREIAEKKPDLLIVHEADEFWWDALRTRYRFEDALAGYAPLTRSDNGVLVLKRRP